MNGHAWECPRRHWDYRECSCGVSGSPETCGRVVAYFYSAPMICNRLLPCSRHPEPPASDSCASASPEQTPTPAADSAHSGDHSTVGETP